MARRTRVVLLWHLHQPDYRHPLGGAALMPWTALHATAAYLDMADSLERAPEGIRCAVTFVPVLLDQLETFAGGGGDRVLDLATRAVDELGEGDVAFIRRHFFSARRDTRIDSQPRYRELAALRGDAGRRFTQAELSDLQVLFSLAWFGPTARREHPEVAEIAARERGFPQGDKDELARVRRRVAAGLVDRWRRLAAAGRVEPVTVPYHHPILPLLLDSDVARRCQPERPVPPRFSWPADAEWQVTQAVARHAEVFGSPPVGVWPAEGSVSPEATALLGSAGLRWAATDEGVLARSRTRNGPPPPDGRFRVWRLPEAGDLRLVFRDHDLSDRIGFAYAPMPAGDAVADLTGRVRAAPGEAPIVVIALDGENPWEAFLDNGEEFRARLYQTLVEAPDLEPVTPGDLLDEPAEPLAHLHTGSWIDSNFRIWIGGGEENLAWTALGEARRAVACAAQAGHPSAAEALDVLRAAEGSDWFWWYGDDFQIEQGDLFDELFRSRLARACALVGVSPPPLAEQPIRVRTATPAGAARGQPTALVSPRVDGRYGPVLDWSGAALVRPSPGASTMAAGQGRIAVLRVGFDLRRLYVRVEALPGGFGAQVRVRVAARSGSVAVLAAGEELPAGAEAAQGDVFEASLPWEALGAEPGDFLRVAAERFDSGLVVERVPAGRAVELTVPDRASARRLWQV